MRDWLFKLLFPKQYDHMGHLVDDVIRLEKEKVNYCKDCDIKHQNDKLLITLEMYERKFPINCSITTGSNSKQYDLEDNIIK